MPETQPIDTDPISRRHARYGLVLFAIYLVFYAGFVLLNAFAPSVMGMTFLAGVNLAVWYGIALIVAAVLLGLVYAWLCRA